MVEQDNDLDNVNSFSIDEGDKDAKRAVETFNIDQEDPSFDMEISKSIQARKRCNAIRIAITALFLLTGIVVSAAVLVRQTKSKIPPSKAAVENNKVDELHDNPKNPKVEVSSKSPPLPPDQMVPEMDEATFAADRKWFAEHSKEMTPKEIMMWKKAHGVHAKGRPGMKPGSFDNRTPPNPNDPIGNKKPWSGRPGNGLPGPPDMVDKMPRPGEKPGKNSLMFQIAGENDEEGGYYQVLNRVEHDATSFTQGLTYYDGFLYESAGLYRKSSIRRLDPISGDIIAVEPMEGQFFGEGMTYYGDNRLIQLTWKSKTGFIYNATDLQQISNFTFSTTREEGWGITYDVKNDQFIVSDGSNVLHFWDAQTLEETHTVQASHVDGRVIKNLNELEMWNGYVLANVWYTDHILAINPITGNVTHDINFETLWPHAQRTFRNDVFNGISVTDVEDELFVTGKKWPMLFRIKMNMDMF